MEFGVGELCFCGGSYGFFIASFAVEVALVGDAEEHDGGDMDAVVFPGVSCFGCFFLPAVGFVEEECLCGMSEADFDEVFEKDFQRVVKYGTKVGVIFGHFFLVF